MSEVVLMDGAADEPDVTGPACVDDVTEWNCCTEPPPRPAYSIELTDGGIRFDGRTFAHLGGYPWVDFAANVNLMHLLDLAYRGRRGDAGAVQLLTAFGVVVNDADGQPYWPVEERK